MSNPLSRTNDSRVSKRTVGRRLVLPIVVALTALAGSAPAMATPIPTAAGPTPTVGSAGATAQGIIMRDGGICDPIRHMGC